VGRDESFKASGVHPTLPWFLNRMGTSEASSDQGCKEGIPREGQMEKGPGAQHKTGKARAFAPKVTLGTQSCHSGLRTAASFWSSERMVQMNGTLQAMALASWTQEAPMKEGLAICIQGRSRGQLLLGLGQSYLDMTPPLQAENGKAPSSRPSTAQPSPQDPEPHGLLRGGGRAAHWGGLRGPPWRGDSLTGVTMALASLQPPGHPSPFCAAACRHSLCSPADTVCPETAQHSAQPPLTLTQATMMAGTGPQHSCRSSRFSGFDLSSEHLLARKPQVTSRPHP
jgi:hypothetical protein